jgi:hypothetical protein
MAELAANVGKWGWTGWQNSLDVLSMWLVVSKLHVSRSAAVR